MADVRLRDLNPAVLDYDLTVAGSVGIGTTSPPSKLTIDGGNVEIRNGYDLMIRPAGNGNDHRLTALDTGGLDVVWGGAVGTSIMRWTNAGNVGIGTTAPTSPLHVQNAENRLVDLYSSDVNAYIQLRDTADSLFISSDNTIGSFGPNDGAHANNLNIDLTNGKVGIGTTAPSQKLHLNNSAALTATYQKFTNGTATTGTTLGIDADGDFLINNGEAKEIKLYTSDSQRLTIQSGGNVGIGTDSPTETLHVNGNLKVTGTFEVGASGFNVSTGFILAFGVAAPPSGWLACNGSAVSRTTYSALYALIGTTYGAGNGSSTFNVPDLRGRTLIGTDGLAAGSFTSNLGTLDNIGGIGGAQNHTLTTAEMPAHTHAQEGQSACGHDNCNGGWAASIYMHRASSNSKNTINNITSTGGGGSHNNVQPSMAVSYLIKT